MLRTSANCINKKKQKNITKVDKWRENAILISFERGGKKKRLKTIREESEYKMLPAAENQTSC